MAFASSTQRPRVAALTSKSYAQQARPSLTLARQRAAHLLPTVARSSQADNRSPTGHGAQAGLLALFQAFAATKRAVKASQAKVVPQATGPHHGQGTAHVPAAASLTLGPLPTQHAPTSPDLPVTAPATTQGPDGTHYLTVTDALLEAALWMDEVRDLQALRDQLRSQIQELSTKWTQFKGEGSANRASPPAAATSTEAAVATSPSPSPGASPSPASASPSPSPSPANASPSPAAPSPTPSRDVPAEAFISNGPEFCPLTCQVEADPDLEQARTALRRQIRAVSSQLMASNRNTVHTLRGASPQQPSVQLQFTDDSASNSDPCAPVPLPAAEGLGERQAKELRKLWVATAQEVTHLLVQLVQLRQLPAQPKARVTVAYVKEQLLNHMRERLAYLAQDTA